MKALGGLDATFLYLDGPTTPMHIGGLYLFAGQGQVDAARFREHISSRLGVARLFHQRLITTPLDLGRPVWVDTDIDLDQHLSCISLPMARTRRDLFDLAARLFAQPLSMDRPLWHFTFIDQLDRVDGLPAGTFGLLARVHHAAVDGMSGEEVLAALLDISPTPRTVAPAVWRAEPLPTPGQQLKAAWPQWQAAARNWRTLTRETMATGFEWLRQHLRDHEQALPLPFDAPVTPFNQTLSAQRVVSGAELDLARVKAIRHAIPGCTVNDVVLAVCSGALRRYLMRQQTMPDSRSLLAMVPMSVRERGPEEKDSPTQGNQVAGMLVSLASTEADPLQRLLAIQRSALAAKRCCRAMQAEQLLEQLPTPALASTVRLYRRYHGGKRHRPWFNVTITNVPGPQIPLYFAGARLLNQFGFAPIFDQFGLVFVVMSYAGSIGIGITSCPEMLPAPDTLADDLQQALNELESACVPVRAATETDAA